MNSLINMCGKVVQCGYEETDYITASAGSSQVQSQLLELGDYLLNNSELGRTFKLRAGGYNPFELDKERHPEFGYKLAICFGAGIDSGIAYYWATHTLGISPKEVCLVWVDYGQPYAGKECCFCDIFEKYLAGKNLYKWWTTAPPPEFEKKLISNAAYIIPARNLLLAAVAAMFSDRIWVIGHKREDWSVGAPDKTPEFFTRTSRLFSEFYEKSIIVESPFIDRSKRDTILWYRDEGLSMDLLTQTTSCYAPIERKCGVCLACAKRYSTFKSLGIQEAGYTTNPEDGARYREFMDRERQKGRGI